MRPLIAIALVAGCSSSRPATSPGKPVAKSCSTGDAPTLVAAITACPAVFIESQNCERREIRAEDQRSGALNSGERYYFEGGLLMIHADPNTSCISGFEIATIEDGVFELREKRDVVGREREVDRWHIDQARCQLALAARSGPQIVSYGCH